MIDRFAALPVRRKIQVLVSTTLALALLACGILFISYDQRQQRHALLDATRALALVVAQRSQAALAFHDARRGLENLEGLAPVDDVVSACLFTHRTAEPLAQWQRSAQRPAECLQSADVVLAETQFHMAVEVTSRTGALGVLTLTGHYQRMQSRLRYMVAGFALAGIVSVFFALWLTRPLQKMLYQPIVALAEVARNVGQRGDFSVRASKYGSDETGDAVDAFNAMLERLADDKLALEKLAYYDTLTDLPNRRLFMEKLAHAIAHSRLRGVPFGLIFIDLDNFKWVNDTLGHDRGDWLLQVVARRTVGAVRSGDTVARLGGDEFTVILFELDSQAEGERLCQAILQALADPIALGDYQHQAGASLGLAVCDGFRVSVDAALKRADLAVYEAKAAGKNTYRVYSGDG